ncbi:hypothetical protein H4582DRAFT_1475538 [Lactarius indigo]|nr:hypothetical protein H4582DRAFT_1475538 [Lactarius indigo]
MQLAPAIAATFSLFFPFPITFSWPSLSMVATKQSRTKPNSTSRLGAASSSLCPRTNTNGSRPPQSSSESGESAVRQSPGCAIPTSLTPPDSSSFIDGRPKTAAERQREKRPTGRPPRRPPRTALCRLQAVRHANQAVTEELLRSFPLGQTPRALLTEIGRHSEGDPSREGGPGELP